MFNQPRRYFYYNQSSCSVPKALIENKEVSDLNKEKKEEINKEIKKEKKKKAIEELKEVFIARLDKIEEMFGNYKDPLLKINESVEELKSSDLLKKKTKRESKPKKEKVKEEKTVLVNENINNNL